MLWCPRSLVFAWYFGILDLKHFGPFAVSNFWNICCLIYLLVPWCSRPQTFLPWFLRHFAFSALITSILDHWWLDDLHDSWCPLTCSFWYHAWLFRPPLFSCACCSRPLTSLVFSWFRVLWPLVPRQLPLQTSGSRPRNQLKQNKQQQITRTMIYLWRMRCIQKTSWI